MYDAISYKHPCLKEVIVRADFVGLLMDEQGPIPTQLANDLSNQFPICEPVDTISQEVKFGPHELQHSQKRSKQWNFFGRERQKHLALSAQFLFIKYDVYTSYENVKAELSAVFNAVVKAFPNANVARFGMRYVNSFEISGLASPISWDDYFAPPLVTTASFFQEPEHLIRLLHIAELNYGDINLRFHFGLPNPDYPSVIKRPQFILDFDAYVQMAHGLQDSLRYMDQAHEKIQHLFELSITAKTREYMNA
jgi:uncharacterized protein (TIGR04255 family)